VNDNAFVDFVMDQLKDLGAVRSRSMFGGFGLYRGDVFFAIVYEGGLYFKTDASSAPRYRREGMKAFRPRPGQVLKTYYQVPVDVLENDARLVEWARDAVLAAAGTRPPAKKG